MFGGLSMKGESKDDAPAPSSSVDAPSGFSFLQSSIGATAAPASSSAASVASAASSENVEPQAPPPAPSASGSAFGFMSGGASAASNASNAAEDASTDAAAPTPAAAAPSMFAGLTTSAPKEETAAPASSGSMFAGLTTSKAAEPAAAPASSGFSFMSPPAPAPAAEPTKNDIDAASTASTAGSSFSFMNSMASSDNGEAPKENGDAGGSNLSVVQEKEEASAAPAPASGGMSGFSFLSGGAPTSTAPPPPSDVASPVVDQPPTLIPETSTAKDVTPAAPAPSDLLSISSPALPAGSGVSWGAPPTAGGAKKIVKKKRGKRVGVGSAAATSQPTSIPEPASIPEPQQPSSFQPPTAPGSGVPPPAPAHASTPQTPARTNISIPPTPSTPGHNNSSAKPETPVRVKAERAADKADEFIREKQRKSAIALAAERAMQDKGGGPVGGLMPRTDSSSSAGSGWKTNNDLPSSPASPKDETYQAAKAVAEEAKKLDHAAHSKGKASLFGGFFNRGKSGGSNSSNHEISKYSQHGGVVSSPPPVGAHAFKRGGSGGSANKNHSPIPPPKKLEIASYGSPRDANDESERSSGGVDDEARRREAEFERERRAEEKRLREQQKQAEERRRAEEKRLKEEEERRREEEERAERQRIEAEKRRAPREKLQIILDHLADAARTATDDVARLREERSRLVGKRTSAEKAERYAAQQLKFAEAQQTVAAEEEDFEAADRLGTVIEQHAKEREGQAEICHGINESIAKIDAEKEVASKAVAACFAEVQNKLRELQEQVDDRSREEGVLAQFETTSKRLSSEAERLANDLKHIERDEKVLGEEDADLSGQIGEETREFEEKCEEAINKVEQVNKIIEELRKRLAVAEAEAAELNSEISSYNQSIHGIKSKYSRQLGRLEKKSRSVKESRHDWESEMESIEKAKSAHEAVVAAHSEAMVTREKLIDDIRAESAIAKDLEEIVSSAFGETDAEGGAEDGGSDDSALDGEVLKYEAVVNEAKQNVAAAEANIADLKEELSAIELRLPVLEDLKRTAASKRDFKGAGKASKEIKDSLARRERCEAELAGDAMERKQFAEDELEKVTALLEEKKKVAAERGREAGLKRMECLREKIAEMKSLLKKFASEADVSSDGDDEDAMNVSCVGAFVIESQICVLEAEGRALGEKFGGWEETSTDDNESAVESAPSFHSDSVDDDDSPGDIVIDKDILQRYINLRHKLQELEDAIEEAASNEDYEIAAELEGEAEKARDEFEESGFASKKFEQALKEFIPSDSGEDDDAPAEAERVVDDNTLEKYSSLCADIKGFEAEIEKAVAEDDFETAEKVEEKIKAARSDIESLGFSVNELEEALKKGPTNASPSLSPSAENKADDVVEKEGQGEEDAAPEDDGSDKIDDEKQSPTPSSSGDKITDDALEKEEQADQDSAPDDELDDEKKAPDDNEKAVEMNGESTKKEEKGVVDNTGAVADADEDG